MTGSRNASLVFTGGRLLGMQKRGGSGPRRLVDGLPRHMLVPIDKLSLACVIGKLNSGVWEMP
jgi:hypothetical protein